jgi:hypothetical protein
VASHGTAARLWDLAPEGTDDASADVVHVTVPSDRRVVSQPGLRIHLSNRAAASTHPTALPPRTTVEETVLDLVCQAPSLDTALSIFARACQRRRTTPERLLQAATLRAKLRYRRELVAALRDVADGVQSRLELEYRRGVERAHGLPRGVLQSPWQEGRHRRYSDVRYVGFGTTVELDGRVGHIEEGRFRDMRRDNAAVLGGDATLRYGWADVYGASLRIRWPGWDGLTPQRLER